MMRHSFFFNSSLLAFPLSCLVLPLLKKISFVSMNSYCLCVLAQKAKRRKNSYTRFLVASCPLHSLFFPQPHIIINQAKKVSYLDFPLLFPIIIFRFLASSHIKYHKIISFRSTIRYCTIIQL